MSAGLSASARLARVAPLFALSGAVAIGCEAAWFRALRLVFGAAHQTAGAVLAAFMTGLALGAAAGAVFEQRVRRPLFWYAGAEALIGLYAIASPWIFGLAAGVAPRSALPMRALLAFVLLIAPTAAMGATLPLLCAAVAPVRSALRASLAVLYAANLAGGAAGALCAGFVLLPRLGLRWTLTALGAAGLCTAAGAAWIASRSHGAGATSSADPDPESEASAEQSRASSEASEGALAVTIAASLGVASFAMQVAWNRLFAALLGSSAYTFSLVLASVLAALALGGARARGVGTGPRGFWVTASRRLLWLAVAVYLGVLVAHIAPFYLTVVARRGRGIALARTALVALIVGLPSYQIGALFPALASRFPARRPGRIAGEASAVVTVGNVLGALAAGFWSVPTLGVQGTLSVCAVIALALACVCAARDGWEALRGTLLACALGAWLASVSAPRWDPVALSAGSYRVGAYRALGANRSARDEAAPPRCEPNSRRFRQTRVLYYREGASAAVAVIGHGGGPRCSLYSLRVNGKSEGSVLVAAPLAPRIAPDALVLAAGDYPTNVLLGALPALAGAAPGRAMLVGWGTGVTARALLDAGSSAVLAAEIEPAVLEAARVFDAEALRDPRVAIRVDDARAMLARAEPASFDVIVSQPSNPWVSGAASLFSREFFALARGRLREGGRMMAWVQLYETDRASVRSLVATFLTAFPGAHAFRPDAGSRDLLLLGFRGAGPRTREELALRIGQRAREPWALARAGIADTDALMALHAAGPERLAAWARGAEVESDDRGAVEYRVADQMLAGRSDEVGEILRGL